MDGVTGGDFVVRGYPMFGVAFATCRDCGWVESLPVRWEQDADSLAKLLNHQSRHQRGEVTGVDVVD